MASTSFPGSLILPPHRAPRDGKMRDPGNEVGMALDSGSLKPRGTTIWKGRGCSSSRVQIKDSGVTETLPFLSCKIWSYSVHSKIYFNPVPPSVVRSPQSAVHMQFTPAPASERNRRVHEKAWWRSCQPYYLHLNLVWVRFPLTK